jgi:hypothetical protein
MDNSVLMIVLTENHWLFAGLTSLLPGINSRRIDFSEGPRTGDLSQARRILVVVDSGIFLRGKCIVFNALLALRPDATVVWLRWDYTGLVFPEETSGCLILNQKQDVASLRSAMIRILQRIEAEENAKFVSPVVLTQTERYLLPYLASRVSIPELARLTGIPASRLYRHRQNIMNKTGFRQPTFLQLVYERNDGLPGVALTEKRPAPRVLC